MTASAHDQESAKQLEIQRKVAKEFNAVDTVIMGQAMPRPKRGARSKKAKKHG